MAEHPSEGVTVERDGHLAIVTVNRPSKLNALDNLTIQQLDGVIAELEQDGDVGAISAATLLSSDIEFGGQNLINFDQSSSFWIRRTPGAWPQALKSIKIDLKIDPRVN